MQNTSRTLQKSAILVEISLADGTIILGKLFASPQGRLLDVLNDDRAFLPVESTDGTFLALAKSAIKQITLPANPASTVAAESAPYRGDDPYVILGIEEGVSQEDLKKAYHSLSLINHPDRIKGFSLGADYQKLATQNMARINNAYAQIMRRITESERFGKGAHREKRES